MRKNAPPTICVPRVSRSDELARQWLVKFAEICQREVTPQLAAIWAEQLGDVAYDVLDHACDRLAKTWTSTFLPTPGAIRAQFDGAAAKANELSDELEWQDLRSWIRENFHPDIGIRRGAPQLSAAVQHAARAAGGLAFLERCKEQELVFARRTFQQALRNFRETGQSVHLLGNSEAKRLFRKVQSQSALVSSNPSVSEPVGDAGQAPSRDEVRSVFNAVIEEAPVAEPAEEELAANWARQKRALLKHASHCGKVDK